jgi:hypothetical protein
LAFYPRITGKRHVQEHRNLPFEIGKSYIRFTQLFVLKHFCGTQVNGPILNQDDKKTIGTRKRYGIAADVLFGIGGVQSAIAALSDPQLQSCSAGVCSGKFVEADVEVPKSLKSLSASVNEILTICKSYKEFN